MEVKSNKVSIPSGGEAIQAQYREQEIEEYKNNPLIEALPPIYSITDVVDKLSVYPYFNEEERNLATELKLHCIQRLFQYFQPLSNHIDLERRFSRVIRQGYLARNPLRPGYADSLRSGYEMIKNESLEIDTNIFRTTAAGFTIIGISGIGKTTAIDRVLSLYPQIIVHSKYKEINLSLYQIAWLKLDCPFDGSLKGLCVDFFIKVDSLLGTNYYKKFGTGRNSVNVMMPRMAQIAKLHGIGALIIDEIQHLSLAKSGGSEKMLNFFVTLVNTIGVPVILIGTMKAISVLQSEFRQARRGSGQGDMVWDRMKKDRSWDLFVEAMFRYQWTKEAVGLTDELNIVLYEESQGIIDIAVKLYTMAQITAVINGKKTISPKLIEQVAKDNFKLVKPMLDALKSGNIERIMKYEDIRPVDVEAFFAEQVSKLKFEQEIKAAQEAKIKNKHQEQQVLKETAILKLIELDVESAKAKKYVEQMLKSEPNLQLKEIVKKGIEASIQEQQGQKLINEVYNNNLNKTKSQQNRDTNDLRTIVDNGKKKKRSAYDVLKESGWIKPPLEDILKIG